MPKSRNTLLQRISDGLLPYTITKYLYRPFFQVHQTDVNGWSIMHFLSGILTSLFITQDWKIALLIHTVWELFQFVAGDNLLDIESGVDITLDTLFFMLGFELARLFG